MPWDHERSPAGEELSRRSRRWRSDSKRDLSADPTSEDARRLSTQARTCSPGQGRRTGNRHSGRAFEPIQEGGGRVVQGDGGKHCRPRKCGEKKCPAVGSKSHFSKVHGEAKTPPTKTAPNANSHTSTGGERVILVEMADPHEDPRPKHPALAQLSQAFPDLVSRIRYQDGDIVVQEGEPDDSVVLPGGKALWWSNRKCRRDPGMS